MIPRLKIPIAFNGSGFATVEQDSPVEVAQAVYASLSTEEGTRVELVDYGLPSQLFRQGGASEDEIRATVERDEPRAAVLTETEWEGLMETIRVQVST